MRRENFSQFAPKLPDEEKEEEGEFSVDHFLNHHSPTSLGNKIFHARSAKNHLRGLENIIIQLTTFLSFVLCPRAR